MASKIKRRGKWYFRSIIYLGDKKQKEIQYPLKTKSKTTANTRLLELQEYEDEIKAGRMLWVHIQSKFRWANENGTSGSIRLCLKDVIPDYLKYRRIRQRKKTVKKDYYTLKQLTEVLGENKIVQEITYKDMEEKFIPYYQNKGYEDGGISLSCRTIKVFLNYLFREKLIPEKITFKIPKVDQEPCFINRAEINALHKIVDARFKRWFLFYELTGCRASDPFLGFLENNLWKIPPEEAKTKHWHYYRLTDELKYIWMELQELKQSYMDKKKSKEQAIDTCYQLMQKNMYRAIKKLRKDGKVSQSKKLTLNSFRHTFGIIDVTITNDIWGTSKRMNHKEIGVTQDYLDLQNYYDLGNEFPELKPYLVDKKSILQGKAIPDRDSSLSPHTPKLGDYGHVSMDTRG